MIIRRQKYTAKTTQINHPNFNITKMFHEIQYFTNNTADFLN